MPIFTCLLITDHRFLPAELIVTFSPPVYSNTPEPVLKTNMGKPLLASIQDLLMIQTEKLTESEIINRIATGEKSLYELIVRRYNPHLYKVGRSYNYNHEDTQDLMQDTFIDAYRNLQQFE